MQPKELQVYTLSDLQFSLIFYIFYMFFLKKYVCNLIFLFAILHTHPVLRMSHLAEMHVLLPGIQAQGGPSLEFLQ